MTTEIQTEQKTQTPNHSDKIVQFPQAQAEAAPKTEEAKSDNRTCDAEEAFSVLLEKAITIGSGYHQKLREVSAAHYAVAYEYHTNEAHRKMYEAKLKTRCSDDDIEVTAGKTSSYHMIVRLTFQKATKQYVSDKVHVLLVALAKQVKPEGFADWLETEKGERKVVETYKRDGSLKQKGNSGNGKGSRADATQESAERETQIKLARERLISTELLRIDGAAALPRVTAPVSDTECAAIILHCTDGSIVIKTLVRDNEVTDEVYSAYFRANAGNIERANVCERIEKLLDSDKNLDIDQIRSELGDEITKKITDAWESDQEWNAEMSDTPSELQEYVKKLRRADGLVNLHGDSAAESAYEDALEELAQVMERDPNLAMHLDRPWCDDISPDYDTVPRLNNSKSRAREGNGPQTIGKQKSLRDALRVELENLRGTNNANTQAATASLAEAMELINKHRALN